MTTERSLLSMSQLQRLAERQPNLTMWMWGGQQPSSQSSHRQEDSWEVRAFMDDAGNAAGATWPSRSYSCTFCRREFRSAQALGGHMNVHRRDRAKLRQGPQGLDVPSKTPSPPPPVNFGSLDIIRDVSVHSYQFMGPLGNDIDMRGKKNPNTVDINGDYEVMEEELDLELRLGR